MTDAEFDAKVSELRKVAGELADYATRSRTRGIVVVLATADLTGGPGKAPELIQVARRVGRAVLHDGDGARTICGSRGARRRGPGNQAPARPEEPARRVVKSSLAREEKRQRELTRLAQLEVQVTTLTQFLCFAWAAHQAGDSAMWWALEAQAELEGVNAPWKALDYLVPAYAVSTRNRIARGQ